MKAPVYNLKEGLKEEIELSSAVFGKELNNNLVYQVYKNLLSNQRQPLAFSKDRSEIKGGGRKPWVQKGTGRARHGSIRSPLWKGGGATFGPRTKEQNTKRKINKKVRQEAIRMVLSQKLKDGEVKIIEEIKLEKPQTNTLDKFFKSLFDKKEKLSSILLVINSKERNFSRSAKNLAYIKVINAENINLIDLLNNKYLLLSKSVLSTLENK
ncbi:MAG: 50S ribosomal protein L4 [Candidatus Pacebacteria bacterium]|jgi:large subunit ribosomal protein L4|nr:50S ribosomal protein L4 [Candidatus Paceibacterota bacterium]MDD4994590.1 50S ribosomal protein L4 [Candidatus Paceibacterota bacterium]MDD5535216.1 50S ribosomal protein L4 [Candidatus Paceibacterota bacterium]